MKAPKLFLKPLLFMVVVFGIIAAVTSITFGNRLKREMTREYEAKALALAYSIAESDIGTILGGDKSIAFPWIEPFDCSFWHKTLLLNTFVKTNYSLTHPINSYT